MAWTLEANELDRNACVVLAFSVPDDRLWCADYSGVIRGRSLGNGELDGTTVEHQRSGLSGIAVQSVDGHRYLVAFGQQSAFVGRWQIDGGGPIARNVAAGYDFVGYSPDGRRLVVGAESDRWPRFTRPCGTQSTTAPCSTQPADLAFADWLDDDRVGAVTERVTDGSSMSPQERRATCPS